MRPQTRPQIRINLQVLPLPRGRSKETLLGQNSTASKPPTPIPAHGEHQAGGLSPLYPHCPGRGLKNSKSPFIWQFLKDTHTHKKKCRALGIWQLTNPSR